jgi:hypothetical protein
MRRLVLYSSCPALVSKRAFGLAFTFCFWVLDLVVRCVFCFCLFGFRVLGLYGLCLGCPVFYSPPTCASRSDSHSPLLCLSVCPSGFLPPLLLLPLQINLCRHRVCSRQSKMMQIARSRRKASRCNAVLSIMTMACFCLQEGRSEGSKHHLSALQMVDFKSFCRHLAH